MSTERLGATSLLLALLWAGCDGEAPSEQPDAGPPYPESPMEAVDVFVGTGGEGFGVGSALPGAAMPFSMAKPSPDTSIAGTVPSYAHCGGYAYDDVHIEGFSQVHMHGIGVPAYGHVRMMPTVGWSAASIAPDGHRDRLYRETEEASPGYYAVTLEERGIRVELTAGERVAYHRYTWGEETEEGDAVVLFDLARIIAGGEVFAGGIEVLADEGRVRGFVDGAGELGAAVTVYFDAVFDRDVVAHGTWQGETVTEGSSAAEGTVVGGWLAFDVAGGESVEAQVGLSYVDVEGASGNREAEAVSGFDEARSRAEIAWSETLGRIEIEGGSARDQRIFYSALYHVYQSPTLLSDADGRYRGLDGEVHETDRRYYSDFSLWDTYRTENPLLILLEPEAAADMAQSLVQMYEDWGGLPRWPLGTVDSGSMVGTPADVVLAESWLKGVRDFDVDTAWEAMTAHADGPVENGGRRGIEEYLSLGYVAADVSGASVSWTQEMAWNDFALANLADARGEMEVAAVYRERSRTITNVWHEESGYFRGRNADGSWEEGDWSATGWQDCYAEGTAWQHLWLTPHPDLLEEVMGGREGALARLTEFFELAREHWEENEYGRLLPLPYYWHGNEPDLHAAYLFAALGEPSETQRWVRWIMDEHYDLGPAGLAGNDDAGTLSAWFVWSALGLYPLVGSDRYHVGTPAFERATVHLDGGDLIVEAPERLQGIDVSGVTIDEQSLDAPVITHDQVAGGATIQFAMSAEPTGWGRRE